MVARSEIYRVLKPGGMFCFDTINRTLKSKILLIWMLEHTLRQIPLGLHDWHQFIPPPMSRSTLFPKFLATWFETHWRSLLLLVLGVYLPLQAFAMLALQVWKLEGGLTWEVPLMMAIHHRATETIDHFAALLTLCGSAKRVAPFALTLALGLLLQKRWRSVLYLVMTLVGCVALNVTAKEFWHRIRPNLWDGYPHLQSFSFPSGHAMTSMALVATLVILTWGSRWLWVTVPLGSLYVVAIGWTRLYLGVHYPSDILAGWMLAIAWAAGMAVLIQPYGVSPQAHTAQTVLDRSLQSIAAAPEEQPSSSTPDLPTDAP